MPAATPAAAGDGHLTDPAWRSRRARLAANARHHPDQPDLTADERRFFKAAAAERYVKELVDGFPPLTEQQRARLAALLHPGGGDDAVAT
jgi:hypothetical protein